MKRLSLVLSISALCVAGCGRDASMDSGASGADTVAETNDDRSAKEAKLDPKDVEFMKEAARGGSAEVKMGELGLSNAESQPVKDFSQRLVDDHSKANQELKKLAIRKGVMLPDGMSEQHKTMLQHLSSLKGREFDTAFRQHAVEDHKKDIEEFKTASAKAKDPEVRSFAEKALPVLQRHLEMAENLSSATTSGP
jgi:putative membrane protein